VKIYAQASTTNCRTIKKRNDRAKLGPGCRIGQGHRQAGLEQPLNIFVALNGQAYASLDAAQKAGAPTLNLGLVINALINFLIIAFVVYWVGKAAARMMRREAAAPTVPPAPTRSEVLLEEIRDELRARPQETRR